jgi:dCTP deaminase
MILTDSQIIEAYKKGDILIDPFDENQVQAATYDLRVGAQGATTSTKKIVNLKETGYLSLQPGDFGVVTCLEIVRLGPQYAARFGLRSKYARKGLIATTGPQIDPGYYGRLIIGITNLTPKPVSLPYKDDLLSVEFHRLEQASTKPYCGPYQGKMELGAEEIEFITETEGMALSEMLTTLRSLTQNVGALTTQIKTLEWSIPLIVVVGITIIGIIVMFKN